MIVSNAQIGPGSITDGKVSNQAKIKVGKLQKVSAGQLLVGGSDGKLAPVSISGDVAIDANGVATVAQQETSTSSTTLTAPEVKSLYESNADTNAFSDPHKTKLDALIAGTDNIERYTHAQSTNQPTWVIDHNLGFYPNVQVYDSDYEEIFADVKHPSSNQTEVNFTGTTAGYAVLS